MHLYLQPFNYSSESSFYNYKNENSNKHFKNNMIMQYEN